MSNNMGVRVEVESLLLPKNYELTLSLQSVYSDL